jgi:hypothetical protein
MKRLALIATFLLATFAFAQAVPSLFPNTTNTFATPSGTSAGLQLQSSDAVKSLQVTVETITPPDGGAAGAVRDCNLRGWYLRQNGTVWVRAPQLDATCQGASTVGTNFPQDGGADSPGRLVPIQNLDNLLRGGRVFFGSTVAAADGGGELSHNLGIQPNY